MWFDVQQALSEIDDHVKAFCRYHIDMIQYDRRRDQPQIGPDQRKRDNLRRRTLVFQAQRVGPGQRAINEAKTVFAFFDVVGRPDLAVNEDLVAKKRIHRGCWVG